MTTWIENPEGGRDRGPRALARAWFEVLVRPRRFFRVGVSPGDQAPGLTFLVVVVCCAETTRYVLVPDAYPALPVSPTLAAAFWLSLVVLLVAPLALHFTAALQTLLLVPTVRDRAGISQTVQVLAYSTAPCVFAGVPVPELRVLCAGYGALLLILGLRIVHETSWIRAMLAGGLPAALVFGYGFRGFAALGDLGLVGPL
ncbi:YIP1 family protein [Halobacteria archaeon AArc-m2/3/4]|uniref:YIP1 family protein n=1 Tax=Natronoglomus mannanivorans TaxID=2979990 RepID=A0AAP2YWW3_9EURY|nr:YIP1 family protein [Halobacteria archaeon AArc-xg1-1]MCU4971500.1 YIP1 family protein [Halobacteria archaeon AArc-m2/3/4]